MSPVLSSRLRFYGVFFVALGILGWIMVPISIGIARHNPRRAACQSNLKQIGLALRLYADDYDDCLPPQRGRWGVLLEHYTNSDVVFQCAETTNAKGTTDYFFNSRFLGTPLHQISSPKTLILMGDGSDNSPLDTTLARLPSAWLKDETSPAWRHLDMANYAFADGHVKWIKANRVDRNFRMVNP